MTLSCHVEFAQGQAEHSGSLTLVAVTVLSLQAVAVVANRPRGGDGHSGGSVGGG